MIERMNFETQRLIIRKPVQADAADIFRNYARDTEVSKYLVWKPHTSEDDSRAWIDFCIGRWNESDSRPFVIWHRDSSQTIGMLDFRIDGHRAEMGYVLARGFWNQGYMTEAAAPVVEELLEQPPIYRIEAYHDVDNPASGRVMQKLGMVYEGTVHRHTVHPNVSNEPRDCALYARVR